MNTLKRKIPSSSSSFSSSSSSSSFVPDPYYRTLSPLHRPPDTIDRFVLYAYFKGLCGDSHATSDQINEFRREWILPGEIESFMMSRFMFFFEIDLSSEVDLEEKLPTVLPPPLTEEQTEMMQMVKEMKEKRKCEQMDKRKRKKAKLVQAQNQAEATTTTPKKKKKKAKLDLQESSQSP